MMGIKAQKVQWLRDFLSHKIIPTRSRQAYSKQICLWDLAQIICIAFIIQVARAI